jgi:hypothetical protein
MIDRPKRTLKVRSPPILLVATKTRKTRRTAKNKKKSKKSKKIGKLIVPTAVGR